MKCFGVIDQVVLIHICFEILSTQIGHLQIRESILLKKKTCKGNKLHIPICVSQFCISNILSDLLQNVNEWFQFCSPYINQITFTLNLPGNGHFSPRCLTNSLVWLKPASSQRIRSSSHYLYSWHIKWQKRAGISGLWVIYEIIKKKILKIKKKIVGAVWKLTAK